MMKDKEVTFEKVEFKRIACGSNRQYTKDEGFEQLKNSIKKYGVIEPPVLRFLGADGYRVIAGRRRIEAARQLGNKTEACIIYGQDDPRSDEEIALTENVNRLAMHPLDEAAAFRRMADAGNPVEEIARYYARSPSAIYKRLRLIPLIEELKGWFRDGIIDIAGAALLAELPEEDQKKFYEQHEPRYQDYDPEDENTKNYIETNGISNQAISQYIYKQQKNKICGCLGDECQTCDKRTHNSGNDLFEEFSHMDDVCLDGDCYRKKWKEAISRALAEKYDSTATDCKIYFRSIARDGIMAQLYKRATHAIFDPGGGEIRFEVLKEKDWEFTGETNRKKDACWEITETVNDLNKIVVRRIGYRERKKKEQAASRSDAGKGSTGSFDKKEIERYGKESLDAVAAERGTSAAELAKTLQNKNVPSYTFTNKISELVYERVVARRVEAEASGAEPPRDYLSMFMRLADEEMYSEQSFTEKNFDERQKKIWNGLFKGRNQKQLSAGLPDETQHLFHFMLLCIGFDREVPELKDLKDIKKSENMFWEYARMDEDEYRELYIQAAKEVTAMALEPKPKKGGKKKETADGAASSSSKRKKGGKKKAEADVSGGADTEDDEDSETENDVYAEDDYPF